MKQLGSSFFFAALLSCSCGSGAKPSKPPTAHSSAVAPDASSSASEADAGESLAAPLEPCAPFSMTGGGPRHHYRSSLAGPAKRPVELFRFTTGGRVFAAPVIGPDSTIYVGSADGSFSAIRPDGNLRWTYIADEPFFGAAAISQTGVVYVGCDDDTVIAFGADGAMRWVYRTAHDADSSPVIGSDGLIYVGGDGLHALGSDGKRRWKVLLGGHVSASPTLRPDGVIAVGSHDQRLYGVLPNGTVEFAFAARGPIVGDAAALENNDLVFGSSDGNVYRLAPEGGLRWKHAMGASIESGVAVSADSSAVYTAAMNGAIAALDATTGKELWRIVTEGAVHATPMLDAEGRLYVGSRDHHLYAIDAAKGEIVWMLDFGTEIDSTVAISEHRRIVAGGDDGVVRILGEPL